MPVERRLDSDGKAYTKKEFLQYYNDIRVWNNAKKIQPSEHQPFVPSGGAKVRREARFCDGFEKGFIVPKRLADKADEFIGTVNDWHYAMLNDHPRNDHYYKGLSKVIIPGETTCLEIGAGSGILSCIAAKLGAKKVVAIEANKHLVKLSRQIVEENGFSDIVTIIHGMSTDVKLDFEPDILVSELFGTLLLSESALHYVSHAREQLIKKGGAIVPQRACQMVQLVMSEQLCSLTSAKEWNGIKLHPFNSLQDTSSLIFSKMHGFRFSNIEHTMLSEETSIQEVDFTKDFPDDVTIKSMHKIPILKTGTIHAVLASWESYSEGAPVMSTHPSKTIDNFPRDMHWGQGIQLIEDRSVSEAVPAPLNVKEGDVVLLTAIFSKNLVTMQFDIKVISHADDKGVDTAEKDN